jgi:hypothetical protein
VAKNQIKQGHELSEKSNPLVNYFVPGPWPGLGASPALGRWPVELFGKIVIFSVNSLNFA